MASNCQTCGRETDARFCWIYGGSRTYFGCNYNFPDPIGNNHLQSPLCQRCILNPALIRCDREALSLCDSCFCNELNTCISMNHNVQVCVAPGTILQAVQPTTSSVAGFSFPIQIAPGPPPNFNATHALSLLEHHERGSSQYEGAFLTEGKGLNNWDIFTHENPGKIRDENNGDMAVDQYHRFMEDIQLMTTLGVNSYRFSISWSRVLPRGRFGGINHSGIKYYNRLIDALISRGIKPFVTLNHLDYPQELENRFQSWLSPEMQNDFGYLADICFKHFGDRVKHWTTLNEPNQQIIMSHLKGTFPPLRCSLPYGNCTHGNSETEPFIAAHNTILAHAKAVHIYRSKYQEEQRGIIGIVVQTSWFEPISDSVADREAAERAQSFYSNWILDPIIYGRYPKEMVTVLGSALPRFSRKEVESLQQSRIDFVGINHYTSYFIQDCLFSTCNAGNGASKAEGFVLKLDRKGTVSIGELTDVNWQHIHPEGFRKMLNYLKNRYHNIPMFITENGFGDLQKQETTAEELLNDTKRIQYMSGYLDALQSAMRDGANVKGYFAWSLLDNFEWLYGYKLRFGLFHVDYTTLKRTPKQSASWYQNFIGDHIRRRDY